MLLLFKYKWPILCAVALAAAFVSGWQVSTWKHDAEALKAIEHMEAKHIAEMKEQAEIIGKEAGKQQEVRIVYRNIYREARAVANGTCGNADFISVWNKANASATKPEADKPSN